MLNNIKEVNKKLYIEKEKRRLNRGLKLSHVSYYYTSNVGDTVLSQCTRRVFNSTKKCGRWNLILPKDEVNENTISIINNSDALVIGGGGLFLPDTNPNKISGWQWAVSKKQLEEITVPIIVYSVGYNFFNGQNPSPLFCDNVQKLVDKSIFFGLRNNGSVNSVKKIVGKKLEEKIVYQPCTTTLISKIYPKGIWKKDYNKNVALNVAFDREKMRYGDNQETILTQIANAAKKIHNRGYKMYYVIHCNNDRKFIPYLQKESLNFNVVDLCGVLPKCCYSFYRAMDVVIGMRGHSQMIPFGMNCEIISLVTHNKMRWFLEDINSEDWYIDLTRNYDEISNRIVDRFESIHEKNRKLTWERLIIEQNRLWNITQENMIIIKDRALNE